MEAEDSLEGLVKVCVETHKTNVLKCAKLAGTLLTRMCMPKLTMDCAYFFFIKAFC